MPVMGCRVAIFASHTNPRSDCNSAGMGDTGMSRILTAALFVLTLSAPALADTVPEGFTLRAYPPVGNGDPNAISCWAWRTTPPIRGLQCARNSEWKRINDNAHFARYNYGPPPSAISGPPMGAMLPGAAGGAIVGR